MNPLKLFLSLILLLLYSSTQAKLIGFLSLRQDITVYTKTECKGDKHKHTEIHYEEVTSSTIKKAQSYRISENMDLDNWMVFGYDGSKENFTIPANTPNLQRGCYNFTQPYFPDWFVVHQTKDPEKRQVGSMWVEVPDS